MSASMEVQPTLEGPECFTLLQKVTSTITPDRRSQCPKLHTSLSPYNSEQHPYPNTRRQIK
ncbi:hypothetical protein PanWU01x14_075570 [Parasponia andersonii]|uniref:Uncharacterized protein n=1 Tax=Parasponia andersonii TaxID=3476 RepID=A0A2P5DCU2_PARAD|nr:hypothetical protein PanWU01x14_075570 [Parasponia andersonii]